MSDEAVTEVLMDTPVEAPVEAPVAAEAAPGEAVVEEAPAPAPQPEKHEPPSWALKRISEESARAREALERAEAAERRAREAEALAERLRRPAQQDEQAPETRRHDPPQPDTALRESLKAELRAEQERETFFQSTLNVKNAGIAAHGAEFQKSLDILNAVGAVNNTEFIQDVLAVDKANAHEILHSLAKDPERAVALATMSSRQRISELTRLSMSTQKNETAPEAPKPVISKAPAPPPPVQPSARAEVDWYSDKASDAEWTRGFRENYKKKYGHYPSV